MQKRIYPDYLLRHSMKKAAQNGSFPGIKSFSTFFYDFLVLMLI